MSILLEKYKNKKKLGKGAYGEVLLVQDPDGKQFAIKMISKKSIAGQPFLEEYLESQKQCMMSVKSKYVMQLFGVEEDNNYIYFICQYCDGGDLLNYQAKQPQKVFSIKDCSKILSEVIHGLYLLHNMGYIHRDIKPQNILLKKDKSGINMYKLADFGFAKKKQDVGGTVLGTENYMAPEIFNNDMYSYQVDMWAFGILFYFMLNMQFPFKLNPHLPMEQKKDQLIKLANNFSYSESIKKSKKKLTDNCTPQIEDLFKKMLHTDPDRRITFAEIRQHPIFKEHFKNDDGASKILYGNKKKGIDRAQSFIQKRSGIQQLGHKQGKKMDKQKAAIKQVQNANPSYCLKRFNTTAQKQIVQLEYERIEFLLQSQQELSINLNFMDPAQILALRYNLLKYYIILLRQFNSNLRPQKYQKKYPNLKWKQFFKTPEFNNMKKQYKQKQDSIQIKISQTYDQCRSSLASIRKYNPKLQLTLEPQVSPHQQFAGKFKQSYRISTIGTYEKVRAMISNGNRYFYLTLLVALCHGYNQIVAAQEEELHDMFKELGVAGKGISKMLDFSQLRSTMTRAPKEKLKVVFQHFLKTYFNINPTD